MAPPLRHMAILNAACRRSIPLAGSGQQMGLRTTSALGSGKESALHQEGRAEEAENAKQDMLREVKEGKGEWKEQLASDSESVIKADRGELKADKGIIEQLQRESAKAAASGKK